MGNCRGYKRHRNNRIWKKTGGKCAHCGKRASGLSKTIDHYIPRSWGGGYDEKNLMPLCRKCNLLRGNKLIKAREFYIYAPIWVIEDCEEYEWRWNICRHRIRVK